MVWDNSSARHTISCVSVTAQNHFAQATLLASTARDRVDPLSATMLCLACLKAPHHVLVLDQQLLMLTPQSHKALLGHLCLLQRQSGHWQRTSTSIAPAYEVLHDPGRS